MKANAASAPLFTDGSVGAVRLMFFLIAAIALMVADFRGGYLHGLRDTAALLNEPLYRLVSAPVRAARWLRDVAVSTDALITERDTLQREIAVARAQLARQAAIANENQRLRELLGGTRGLQMKVRLARLTDIDLDPFRQRVALDLGRRDGVSEGMAVIDGGGVFGQVIAASAMSATAMLVSDPGHAIPVQAQRSGVRTIAYGTGEVGRLHVPNIPQSADVRVGDLLITSGLGGRFPAGLAVATITELKPDDTRLFVVAEAHPAAALDRSGDVLLVWAQDVAEEFGPPEALRTPPTAEATP